MSQTISGICGQLRLTMQMRPFSFKRMNTMRIVEEILNAQLEGRKRTKFNKVVHQVLFPHLKTFDGYQYDHKAFQLAETVKSYNNQSGLKENLLILGTVRTAETQTHRAIAIRVSACHQRQRVQFYHIAELVAIFQV